MKFFSTHIEIEPKDQEAMEALSMIPYAHSNRKHSIFKTTIKNIELVCYAFKGIGYNDLNKLPIHIKDIYLKEKDRKLKTEALLKNGPQTTHDFLYRHQQLGVEMARINNRWGFFYDTRTGKTMMSYAIIEEDLLQNPEHKWLIICPLILIQNAWLEDLHRFPSLKEAVNLHDSSRKKRLEKFKLDGRLYITNTESFVSYLPYIDQLGITCALLDESSSMKSHMRSSKFASKVTKWSLSLKKWYLLSGTPAPNGEWEYYKQLQSIDYYGISDSFSKFEKLFLDNISFNPQFKKFHMKQDMRNKFLHILNQNTMAISKEHVMKTAGKKFIPVYLNMPVSLQKAYRKLKNELWFEISEDLITAKNAGVLCNKLNQVSSGFIMHKDQTYLIDNYRFETLKALLTKIGDEQVLIWGNYIKEFEVFKELYPKARFIYGGATLKQKNQAIEDFKKGNVQYLFANPASADKGLTLTNCHICIYFSLNYSYELWYQSQERIYGSIELQPEQCIYYVLLASNTVDEVIFNTLHDKQDISKSILEHLRWKDE